MKCTAVHKDSFYFTICGAYHFKTALPSFQFRQANISFFPAISHKVRTLVTEITSNLEFTSREITRPRAPDLLSTIIKRRESTSLLVSKRVQIALRAFCEKQNEVRSTTSIDVKHASSICFEQKGRFNLYVEPSFLHFYYFVV